MKKITLFVALLCSISAFSTRYLVQGTGTRTWTRDTLAGEVKVTLATTLKAWYDTANLTAGSEVWLAGGTYQVIAPITLKADVSVYGSFYGTETAVTERVMFLTGNPWLFTYQTILDGNNTDTQGLITTASTNPTYFDGLKITGFKKIAGSTPIQGVAVQLKKNCTLQNSIVCYNSFTGTTTSANGCRGVGIDIKGGHVKRSYIHHNTCLNPIGGISTPLYGAGIALWGSVVGETLSSIFGCTIEDNTATHGGAGLLLASDGNTRLSGADINYCIFNRDSVASSTTAGGGAIMGSCGTSVSQAVTIQNSTFYKNNSIGGVGGGAIYFYMTTVPISVTGCTFDGNTASPVVGPYNGGGALYISTGNISKIKNCSIKNNIVSTNNDGSAIRCNVPVSIENCVINNNRSTATGNSSTILLNAAGSKMLSNTVTNNTVAGTRSVVRCLSSDFVKTSNTFSGNTNGTVAAADFYIPVTNSSLNIIPTTIASSTEVGNPARGFYKWQNTAFPSVFTIYDVYKRFSWRQIETSKDVYDFSVIDNELAALQPGQRFSFRIGALNTLSHVAKGIDVPDYIETEGMGFLAPYNNTIGSTSIFVPDWNNPNLLARIKKLVNALAVRYDNEPKIGWIENGMYGNWGEWHNYPIQYPNAAGQYATPPGTYTGYPMYQPLYAPLTKDPQNPTLYKYKEGTSATTDSVLFAHTNAFVHKQLIQSTSNLPVLFKALNLTKEKPIGIRRDSWGDRYFNDITKYQTYVPTTAEWTLFNDRWKTAPFYTENWGGAILGGDSMFTQINTFHISAIAYGGIDTWTNLTTATQAVFMQCAIKSGYRYQVSNVTATLSDTNLSLTTSWKNINMAPTYENWNVKAYVVNPTTSDLFSSQINIPVNLKDLLNDSIAAIPKNISIPLTEGWKSQTNLEVRVIITDANNHLNPMNLDMAGRKTDGSYKLFSIIISNGNGVLQ